MAITIKRTTLWRKEVPDRAGVLAEVLGPLARAKVDLQVVMGYDIPGQPARAAIEVAPISGKKAARAAGDAGLTASTIPALLVVGDNKPGLGHAIAAAMGSSGVNLAFLVAQVIGRRYSCVIGFETAADADRATKLIKAATRPKKA
jgi:hypothetical protein